MATPAPKMSTSRAKQRALERLSPFELRNDLIALASEHARAAAATMLNAGRGNPDWIATRPREAFFLLGTFALAEAKRQWDEEGLVGGMPQKAGSAQRLAAFLDAHAAADGAAFLRDVMAYGTRHCGFDADAWAWELTDGIIGDHYPEPGRMLVHVERVVHDYLVRELCDGRPPAGKFDLFAVEGGTAAMCYIFDSLVQNGLLRRGDTIALLVPTFPPYLEIPELDRYAFRVVRVEASAMTADGKRHTWRYPKQELARLADPKVRMAFIVNPSNPPSVALGPDELAQIVGIVRRRNPGLMLVTDDVYGTFVPHFRSLMAEVPCNTICVYSFSKNFGCTGWRLGVVAIHADNVFDRKIAALPANRKKALRKRYETLSLHPERLKFIDRMVADSRSVALNHTAGLSLPQQVMMALFALSHLVDSGDAYKNLTMAIVRRRRDQLYKGLGLPPPPEDPLRAWYYVELDFMVWARNQYGQEFCDYMRKNYEPVDFLFRLAEESGVVLMNGGGFGGPQWSLRVSLANLMPDDYAKIGRYLRDAAFAYVEAWKAGTTIESRAGRVRRARARPTRK